MYSGKDFPVISSDGLRLKLQEIPGYTLSVVEARYDVCAIDILGLRTDLTTMSEHKN